MYLLDTNICIFLTNQWPGYESITMHLSGLQRSQIGVSSITSAELYFGIEASARRDQNRRKLERFLAEFEIYPFDHAASQKYGAVRAYLRNKGTPIGPLDTLIASHARSLGAVIVTNNVKEFERVPGLKVDDWTLAPS